MSTVSPPRILLVDDNIQNRQLMEFFLRDEPYQVDCAANGLEAVSMFAASSYDLVFMDLEMPLLDGYGATRAIRAMERRDGRRPIPILVLTAYALTEFRLRCEAAGCTDFLVKPVSRKTILTAASNCLGLEPKPDPVEPPPIQASDLDLLRPLFPIFFDTAGKTLEEGRQALARNDLEGVRRQGHKLKGSALSYGFDALGEAAADLERAGGNGDAPASRVILDQAASLLRLARAEHGITPEAANDSAVAKRD